ncbi:MAG: FKBP-type peptidyl-prolyl cis-trans isomerase [Nocardioidaceae bacterium]
MRRVIVGLTMPVLLVSAGCSGSEDAAPVKVGTLASVTVTGPTTATPVVDFAAPIRFVKTADKIVQAGPGTGPAVERSSLVTVQFVGINATDESTFGTSWQKGPSTFYVNSAVKSFGDGLIGAHAGDRVLIGAQARDAFGATGNLASSVRPGDSVIFVVDVESVAPEQTIPANVPTLAYDSSGDPSKFTADDRTLDKPTSLGIYPIIEGTGPIVKSGDVISVEYFGQIYPDGSVFNAWTGQSFDAQLGANQVIDGWDIGLVGQRVGARVVLVIPPDQAYGKKAQSGIPANSTLIFAIQILAVNAT